jgi:hypothetical protein
VSLLLSVEAVYLVLVHAVPFFADGGNGLTKPTIVLSHCESNLP